METKEAHDLAAQWRPVPAITKHSLCGRLINKVTSMHAEGRGFVKYKNRDNVIVIIQMALLPLTVLCLSPIMGKPNNIMGINETNI